MTGFNLGPQGPGHDSETDGEDQPQSMSLMSGVAGGGGGGAGGMTDADVLGIDGEGSSSAMSKLPQSTLLILGIAVIAFGVLYFMRVSQGDLQRETLAADVRAKIDQAVAKFSNQGAMSPTDPLRPDNINELFEDTESVVAMFATDYTQNQVPVQYVKKNPFVIDRPEQAEDDTPREDTDLERRYQQWLADLKREIQKLNLEAVVGGSTPMAIVDGRSIEVGQRVGSFRAVAIRGQTLRLQAVFEPTGKKVVVNLKMPG